MFYAIKWRVVFVKLIISIVTLWKKLLFFEVVWMRLKSDIRSDSEEGQEGGDQNVVLGDGVWTVAIVSSTAALGDWNTK